jgi:hypothetical protein
MAWTHADLVAYEARRQHKQGLASEGVEKESDLHAQVVAECKRRGWICMRGSMAEPTARPIGEWDATILADGGRVLFVEMKRKGGKLSPEQAGMIQWAGNLGHRVHVIYNLEQFIELTK